MRALILAALGLRYEFLRPLFPDYPRPAIWPDGYYVPTSTGDDVIEKHACVVERSAMLAGTPAREQCFVINDVNFLNNADLDGTALLPPGAPNVMVAAGGTQLRNVLEDRVVLAWKIFTNWPPSTSLRAGDAAKTRLEGPLRIPVAPYQYLCGGQLSHCVPQPGVDRRLDAQARGELIQGGALGDPVDRAMLVFSSREAAEAFARQDPYVTNGLVTTWDVQPWAVVVGA